MDNPDLTHTALRVPSVVPGRWVYLRTWNTWGGDCGERTCGCRLGVVVANEAGGWIGLEGLEPVQFKNRGSFEENRKAVDEYLLSLGAEPVPTEEWPSGSEGVGPREADRTPFRHDDWNEADTRMKTLGYKHVLDREARRTI